MSIQILHRNQIDTTKWNQCIDNSTHPFVYAYSWYLDEITHFNWCAIVYNNYEFVLPLPIKSKLGIPVVYMPFFCQQLGIFGSAECTPQLTLKLLNAIPIKYLKVHYNLYNFLPCIKQPNYQLALNSSYDNLYSNYSKSAKKYIRRIIEDEHISFEENTDIESSIANYRNIYGHLNLHIKDKDYSCFKSACAQAKNRNHLLNLHVKFKNELIATAIFLKNRRYLHNVCAAPTLLGREKNIMHGIINYIILKYAETNMILDFEGSKNKNVAEFYKKFNSQLVPYYSYQTLFTYLKK